MAYDEVGDGHGEVERRRSQQHAGEASKRIVTRNPIDHGMGVSNESDPFHIVPIQFKNFTPVGTAIRNDMKAKKGSGTPPVRNM